MNGRATARPRATLRPPAICWCRRSSSRRAYAPAWFVLGELREKLGDRAGAVAAFAQAREPTRRIGTAPRCILQGSAPNRPLRCRKVTCARCSTAMRRDSTGVDRRAELPRARASVRAVAAAQGGRRMKFGSVLDLGCGTGLAALPFRPVSDWMVGVDLSPAMLGAGARQRSLRSAGRSRGVAVSRRRSGAPGALSSHPRRAMCSSISTILRLFCALRHRCWRRTPCWRSASRPMTVTASCARHFALRPWRSACASRAGRGRAETGQPRFASTRTEKALRSPG